MPHAVFLVGQQVLSQCLDPASSNPFLSGADRDDAKAVKAIEKASKGDLIKMIVKGHKVLTKDNVVNELHLLNGARTESHLAMTRASLIHAGIDTKATEKMVDRTLAALAETGSKEDLEAARAMIKHLEVSMARKESCFQDRINNQKMLSGQLAASCGAENEEEEEEDKVACACLH